MKKLIYISVAALTLLSSQIAYASSKKLTEDQVVAVKLAVFCNVNETEKIIIDDLVPEYAPDGTDAKTLLTMKKLAREVLDLSDFLPETTMTTICDFS